jgi:hypothetical protein
MKVGVIQSNYVPWRGYFDLIDDVDLFIFYDDVQFTKNDWRNRNRIKTSEGTAWLTVPVRHLTSTQLILETEIDDSRPWRSKQLKSLAQWYGQAPYFAHYYPALSTLLETPWQNLADLNHSLCAWLMRELGIATQVQHSRDYRLDGTRGDRLLGLLEQAGATSYLSGPSARCYLNEEAFRKQGIQLFYKTYDYPKYPQPWGPFIGEVTVLDLLFNTGPNARHFMKSRSPAEKAQHLHTTA